MVGGWSCCLGWMGRVVLQWRGVLGFGFLRDRVWVWTEEMEEYVLGEEEIWMIGDR